MQHQTYRGILRLAHHHLHTTPFGPTSSNQNESTSSAFTMTRSSPVCAPSKKIVTLILSLIKWVSDIRTHLLRRPLLRVRFRYTALARIPRQPAMRWPKPAHKMSCLRRWLSMFAGSSGRCRMRQTAASKTAINKKNPWGPKAPIIQPTMIGPEIAPTPLMNTNPPDAAAMSSCSKKSFV